MKKRIEIEQLIELAAMAGSCFLDVRSEGEFKAGHFPGAVNLPLLRDEERHLVGIEYKKLGQQAAVDLGFELVGAQFAEKVKQAREIAQDREVVLYCWRGGLRSNIMQWLLQMGGLSVLVLEGGYKAWRQEAARQFAKPLKLRVLSGKTGVGKTELLHALRKSGAQIIDLELLAKHKGSSFGGLGVESFPTQEQFENDLGFALTYLNDDEAVWVEDESRFIGKIRIPDMFFNRMTSASRVEVERSKEIRVARVLEEYGHFSKDLLQERTISLTKRMGGDRVKISLEGLEKGDMKAWLAPLLDYYDRGYEHFQMRTNGETLGKVVWEENALSEEIATQLISLSQNSK